MQRTSPSPPALEFQSCNKVSDRAVSRKLFAANLKVRLRWLDRRVGFNDENLVLAAEDVLQSS